MYVPPDRIVRSFSYSAFAAACFSSSVLTFATPPLPRGAGSACLGGLRPFRSARGDEGAPRGGPSSRCDSVEGNGVSTSIFVDRMESWIRWRLRARFRRSCREHADMDFSVNVRSTVCDHDGRKVLMGRLRKFG